MSEVYTFDNVDNIFNQEFNDKLITRYHPNKITIYVDKEITTLEDIQPIFVRIGTYTYRHYYDSYEFINNKISFTISSINVDYNKHTKNKINIYCNKKYNIKSVEIEIRKKDLIILCDEDNYDLNPNDIGKYIIKSDYFNTFDELIEYIMHDSGLNYELSKKYLIQYSGTFWYTKYSLNGIDEDNMTNDITLAIGENDEKKDDYY